MTATSIDALVDQGYVDFSTFARVFCFGEDKIPEAPEFEEKDYYGDSIEQLKKEIAELEAATPETARAMLEKKAAEERQSHDFRAKQIRKLQVLQSLQQAVSQWDPPAQYQPTKLSMGSELTKKILAQKEVVTEDKFLKHAEAWLEQGGSGKDLVTGLAVYIARLKSKLKQIERSRDLLRERQEARKKFVNDFDAALVNYSYFYVGSRKISYARLTEGLAGKPYVGIFHKSEAPILTDVVNKLAKGRASVVQEGEEHFKLTVKPDDFATFLNILNCSGTYESTTQKSAKAMIRQVLADVGIDPNTGDTKQPVTADMVP